MQHAAVEVADSRLFQYEQWFLLFLLSFAPLLFGLVVQMLHCQARLLRLWTRFGALFHIWPTTGPRIICTGRFACSGVLLERELSPLFQVLLQSLAYEVQLLSF